MLGYLAFVLFMTAVLVGFWFIVPAATRGLMGIWYPTISEKWLGRWILVERAWLVFVGLWVLIGVAIDVFRGR